MGACVQKRKEVAGNNLAALPQCATWVWSEGTAEGGTANGGPSVFIEVPDGETAKLLEASGSPCSSCRAEMTVLRAVLIQLSEHSAHIPDPVILCTDSQAALARFRAGLSEQEALIGGDIWSLLSRLATEDSPFLLQ